MRIACTSALGIYSSNQSSRTTECVRFGLSDLSGGPDLRTLRGVPEPVPAPDDVLVRGRAFGLNRADIVVRRGGSGSAVTLPRILGIECVGEDPDLLVRSSVARKPNAPYRDLADLVGDAATDVVESVVRWAGDHRNLSGA